MLLMMFFGLISLGICLTSCENSLDEQEGLRATINEKAIHPQLMELAELPAWLSERITDISLGLEEFKVSNLVLFYQFTWKGEVFYMMTSAYVEPFQMVFASGGEQIELNNVDIDNISKESSDWKCIYVIDYVSPYAK